MARSNEILHLGEEYDSPGWGKLKVERIVLDSNGWVVVDFEDGKRTFFETRNGGIRSGQERLNHLPFHQ